MVAVTALAAGGGRGCPPLAGLTSGSGVCLPRVKSTSHLCGRSGIQPPCPGRGRSRRGGRVEGGGGRGEATRATCGLETRSAPLSGLGLGLNMLCNFLRLSPSPRPSSSSSSSNTLARTIHYPPPLYPTPHHHTHTHIHPAEAYHDHRTTKPPALNLESSLILTPTPRRKKKE